LLTQAGRLRPRAAVTPRITLALSESIHPCSGAPCHPRPFEPSIKSHTWKISSTFGNTCPQNGSKNDTIAPRTTLECPHEGPSAGSCALHVLTRSESINAFSVFLSTEGRVVGLCWANQNLKDLKAKALRPQASQKFGSALVPPTALTRRLWWEFKEPKGPKGREEEWAGRLHGTRSDRSISSLI
jgi:hypothetical protein